MKLIYSKLNESEPQIEMETKTNLNAQADNKDEEEIKMINDIHHIIEVHAKAFHLILNECSYELQTSGSKKIEFKLNVEGNPHLVTMMMIAAHAAIMKSIGIQLDAFYGTIHISHEGSNSFLVFNAVPAELFEDIKH